MKKFFALFMCIALPTLMWAQVSIQTYQVACYNMCTGSATATATYGTPPYTYVWAPMMLYNQTATGLCAGTYTVTVTDQMNVTQTQTCQITQPAFPLNSTLTTMPSGPICAGSSVTFSVVPGGGTAPYTVLWSFPGGSPSSSTFPSVTVTYNTAGMYNAVCSITDSHGCAHSSTITVTVSAVTVGGSIGGSTSYCSTTNSGSLILSGHTGNVLRWEFSTDGGLTWVNVVNTTATYAYTNVMQNTLYRALVQSGSCATQYSATASITINTPPVISVGPSSANICAGNSLTLTSSAALTYTWIPGNLVGNPITVTPTSTTTYTCIGTDVNGCTGIATATVTVNSNPAVIATEIPATCNGAGTLSAAAVGGTPPYVYVWNPGPFVMQSITVIGANQTYTVDVTDANGCTAQATQFLSDSCDYVWPGDANDDAIADNVDILDIGIANGATGTTRSNATTSWIGQPSTAWGQTLLSGTDYKWVDCDGNGTINLIDTQAVTLNYGLTHNNRYIAPTYSATAPNLMISFDQDSLTAGQAGSLTLSLGDAATPANNIYGVAFRLNYDAAQLSTPTFGMMGGTTWIGTAGTDLMRVVLHPNAAMGFVDVAITRYDHQNVSGNGNIAQVYFSTTNTLVGTGMISDVAATLSNVVVIDNAGAAQTVNVVNDHVVVADSGIILSVNPVEPMSIAVYPNPANEQVQIVLPAGERQLVTIEDVSGRIVYSQYHSAGTSSIAVAEFADGIYVLRATSGNGNTVSEKLAIRH